VKSERQHSPIESVMEVYESYDVIELKASIAELEEELIRKRSALVIAINKSNDIYKFLKRMHCHDFALGFLGAIPEEILHEIILHAGLRARLICKRLNNMFTKYYDKLLLSLPHLCYSGDSPIKKYVSWMMKSDFPSYMWWRLEAPVFQVEHKIPRIRSAGKGHQVNRQHIYMCSEYTDGAVVACVKIIRRRMSDNVLYVLYERIDEEYYRYAIVPANYSMMCQDHSFMKSFTRASGRVCAVNSVTFFCRDVVDLETKDLIIQLKKSTPVTTNKFIYNNKVMIGVSFKDGLPICTSMNKLSIKYLLKQYLKGKLNWHIGITIDTLDSVKLPGSDDHPPILPTLRAFREN